MLSTNAASTSRVLGTRGSRFGVALLFVVAEGRRAMTGVCSTEARLRSFLKFVQEECTLHSNWLTGARYARYGGGGGRAEQRSPTFQPS